MSTIQKNSTLKVAGAAGRELAKTTKTASQELIGLKAPALPGTKHAQAAAAAAATQLLKPMTEAQSQKPAAQKQAKLAAAFIDQLSPKQAIGFRFSTDAYHKLPEPAKATLNAFARVREHVSKVAHDFGVGPANLQTTGLDLHASLLEEALDQALKPLGKKGAQAAAVLEAAAKGTKDSLLSAYLKEVAVTWKSRSENPGWQASVNLRSVEFPTPAPSASPARASTRHRDRAEQEWNQAPRARGWESSLGMRELVKDTYWEHPWPTDDIRAFTQGEWLAHRVPQLEQAEANIPIPDWL